MRLATVYWIHIPEVHTNPEKEGYVGISCDYKRRFKEHQKSANNPHLKHVLKLYKDVIDTKVLHQHLILEEAKLIEKTYRPKKNTGWNIAKGGGMPPGMKGKKRGPHSEETILKIRQNHVGMTGKKHSEETKLKMSIVKKGKTFSAEHKMNLSKNSARRGKPAWNKGMSKKQLTKNMSGLE